jgi:hypothetical protein
VILLQPRYNRFSLSSFKIHDEAIGSDPEMLIGTQPFSSKAITDGRIGEDQHIEADYHHHCYYFVIL